MGVAGGEFEVPNGLGGQLGAGDVTVTLVGVAQHEGVTGILAAGGIVDIDVGAIDVTTVGAAVSGPSGIVIHVPVRDIHAVDGLVEGEFTGEGERETDGQCVVEADGALPDRGHLEVVGHSVEVAGIDTVLRRDGGGELLGIDLVQLGDEVVHVRVEFNLLQLFGAIAITGLGVLDHQGVGRHVGEEHQGQTAGEETGTAADLEASVTEDIPGKAQTGRYLQAGFRPQAGVQVLAVGPGEVVDGLVGDEV